MLPLLGNPAPLDQSGDRWRARTSARCFDPPNECVDEQTPGAAGERVITRTMWRGIFFAAVVMAAGTLAVFDVSLPGGLIEGTGTTAYARTMAFTTLMVFQLFKRVQRAIGGAQRV